jgi:hypothetical protein
MMPGSLIAVAVSSAGYPYWTVMDAEKNQRFSEMNHTCSVPIQLGWVLRCRVVPTAAPLTIVGAHRCSLDAMDNAENFIFYDFIANRLRK